MKAADLVGKQVITSDAQVLGQIEGVEVDVSGWTVSNLFITLLKSNVKKLNFRKPILGSVTVCLPVDVIKTVGDVISLSESIQSLKYIPEFKIQDET